MCMLIRCQYDTGLDDIKRRLNKRLNLCQKSFRSEIEDLSITLLLQILGGILSYQTHGEKQHGEVRSWKSLEVFESLIEPFL